MTTTLRPRADRSLAAEPRTRGRHADAALRRVAVVHKFGGAALATAHSLQRAAQLVATHAEAPGAVVVSALAGVTDTLLEIARRAASPDRDRAPHELGLTIAELRDRHLRVLDELATGADATAIPVHDATIRDATIPAAASRIDEAFAELAQLASGIREAGVASPALLDRVLARGERLSALLFAIALERCGVRAEVVDATALVHTDGRHGEAAPLRAATAAAVRHELPPLIARGVVPVVPGFIGRGRGDTVVTLGRGGSDLTAALVGGALGAREVVLWKDVDGIFTADPAFVPGARLVPRLGVRDAAALAAHGAKVLHPRTLVALPPRLRLIVRSFANPGAPGTAIVRGRVDPVPVRAIAATAGQALVAIRVAGYLRLPELTARALGALHRATLGGGIEGQTSTDHAIGILVRREHGTRAAAVLREAFATELARGELGGVVLRDDVATIGVVGAGLGDARISARVLHSLGRAGIEVVGSSHGVAAGSLSVVVPGARCAEAQRALHDAFLLHKTGGGRLAGRPCRDVVILGAGGIGRALVAQLLEGGRRTGLRVCALLDSRGAIFDPRGLSRSRLRDAIARKRRGESLVSALDALPGDAAELLAAIDRHALARPVIVDATAADTTALLTDVLARGWDVVLANKVPLVGAQPAYDALRAAARATGRVVLHEATVGAGLPVIDTLLGLQATGDRVLRVEGCPSGTLGFLFGELARGRPFSDALRDAVAAGYTEPDPRLDLAGTDVARKALILARLLGFRGDLADVGVESLVPEEWRSLERAEFLARLPELDAAWRARVAAAAAHGRTLRYRARVTPRSVEVGIVAVELADPLGSLTGTDNQFAFTTRRYAAQPLVITGPGAGAEVTAAGVFGDLLRLAPSRDLGEGR